MNLRVIAFPLIPLLLGAVLLSSAKSPARMVRSSLRDDRTAIRADLDKIFTAFVNRDCATIRATHASNWIGFTIKASSIVKGRSAYIAHGAAICEPGGAKRPSISSYKITEIDYVVTGNTAIVPYVADVRYGKDPSVVQVRSLDIYQKVNGHWTQIASSIGWSPKWILQQFRSVKR